MTLSGRNMKVISGCLALVLAAAVFYLFKPGSPEIKLYENKLPVADASAFYPAGPIFSNNAWQEKVSFSKDSEISRIEILFATYARINQGNLTLSLIDEKGKVRASNVFNLSSLKDNSYFDWKFKSQKFLSGETIVISIESDATQETNGIAVYTTKKRETSSILTTLSGKEIPGSGVLTIFG